MAKGNNPERPQSTNGNEWRGGKKGRPPESPKPDRQPSSQKPEK